MPKYAYRCKDCDSYFEVRHSMSERLEWCDDCNSNSLTRVPQMPFVLKTKKTNNKRKVGELVKEYIEEAKNELSGEKEILKNKEFDL